MLSNERKVLFVRTSFALNVTTFVVRNILFMFEISSNARAIPVRMAGHAQMP